MADPIGITFMPSAEASANGPRQAGIEGQGGSDLAQAFKILSLHLPRVLGASAIAPRRLVSSQGSAGVAAPAGVSPYSQVFEALLQSLGVGGSMGDTGSYGPQSLASLFGGGGGATSTSAASSSPYGSGTEDSGGSNGFASPGAPAPKISFGTDPSTRLPDVYGGGPAAPDTSTTYAPEQFDSGRQDTQYI